jgi:hypothetical protein
MKNLTAFNVMDVMACPLLELGVTSDLISKCWSIIERNTIQAIKSPGFLAIQWKVLNRLLMNSRLTVSEYFLATKVVE